MMEFVVSPICVVSVEPYILVFSARRRLFSIHKEINSAKSNSVISAISWVWKILYCKCIPQQLFFFNPSLSFQQITKGLPQNVILLGE